MRKNIPQPVRKLCWINYIGTKYDGNCYVCNDIITPFNFEAGHIVPYDANDKNSSCVENLRPVCSPCNKAVGNKNMDEYKINYKLERRAPIINIDNPKITVKNNKIPLYKKLKIYFQKKIDFFIENSAHL